MAKQPNKAKSPYQRYGKAPYQYTFRRCEHNHTHRERYMVDGQTYKIDACNACNTVRSNPIRVR